MNNQVLFVPCGWAHAVRNLPGPPTVALSANYVDGSNSEKFIKELKWQAIAEQEAELSEDAAGAEGGGRSAALLRAFTGAISIAFDLFSANFAVLILYCFCSVFRRWLWVGG